MASTTLHDKFASAGAQWGQFAGAETPSSFGDPAAELRALLHGAAVYELSWRGMLILTGSDRVRWLNGMITNNIRDLAEHSGNYNFMLSPQGRIQGDMDAYNRGDYLLVTAERQQLPRIAETFDKYIIMDDVSVTEASDKLVSIGISGPTSHEMLMRAGFELPVLEPGQVFDTTWRDIGLSLVRGVTVRVQSYELWVAPDNACATWDALTGAGAVPVGTQAFEYFRMLNGIPRYGVDITERDLPQETAQNHALHYSKGCYVGQEIVERIHSRGNVHRTLVGFELSAGELPTRGTKVQFNGKDVGEITSAASIPIDSRVRNLALGFLRREASQPGTEVQVGNSTALVAALPFQI
jgi:folate-binding protein YgfZ